MGSASAKAVAVENNTVAVSQAANPAVPGEKPKCKACCACPETKKIRDTCVMENGQENCSKEIEDHKDCMRKMGFNI